LQARLGMVAQPFAERRVAFPDHSFAGCPRRSAALVDRRTQRCSLVVTDSTGYAL
jgi:hypothetical protein